MLRGDLHHHINHDPVDGRFIRHSIGELIDHAAASGLQVLSVTCHESRPYDQRAISYAADKGVLLLPGMEATVNGQHVLLLNFREFPSGICSTADIAALKDADALVIAPHPFYPTGIAGGDILREHWRLFDAIEFSGMYTGLTKVFNRRAQEFAESAGLPVVGNTDTHFLWQLGRTFSWIDAAPDKESVLSAIRHGRVKVSTRPLSWHHAARFIHQSGSTRNTMVDAFRFMRKVLRRTQAAERRLSSPVASASS